MKRSSLTDIRNTNCILDSKENISNYNGDALCQSDGDIESECQETPCKHNPDKSSNKCNFKRKSNIFKVFPWKWIRNPKNKRAETNIKCVHEGSPCICQNNSSTNFIHCAKKHINKCLCTPSKNLKDAENNSTNSRDVCIVFESSNSKNSHDEPSCSSEINEEKTLISNSFNSTVNESPFSSVPSTGSNNVKANGPPLSALMPKSSHEHLKMGSLTQELFKLSKCGWYWGPITRNEADEKLLDQPDGAFLVRDSSDDRYLLSLSFRSCGQTLHTRIEHSNGLFSFYTQKDQEGHTSIIDLIGQSIDFSQSGVYCYSRSRSPGSPSYPVRLTKPISRFTQVRTLQYLCRFVIRQYTRFDHLQKLPLPPTLKGYLEEAHY